MSIGSLCINIPYKWMFIFTPYVEHQRTDDDGDDAKRYFRRKYFNKTWETSE